MRRASSDGGDGKVPLELAGQYPLLFGEAITVYTIHYALYCTQSTTKAISIDYILIAV